MNASSIRHRLRYTWQKLRAFSLQGLIWLVAKTGIGIVFSKIWRRNMVTLTWRNSSVPIPKEALKSRDALLAHFSNLRYLLELIASGCDLPFETSESTDGIPRESLTYDQANDLVDNIFDLSTQDGQANAASVLVYMTNSPNAHFTDDQIRSFLGYIGSTRAIAEFVIKQKNPLLLAGVFKVHPDVAAYIRKKRPDLVPQETGLDVERAHSSKLAIKPTRDGIS